MSSMNSMCRPYMECEFHARVNSSKLGVYRLKLCLATSQTQFGLTSNLLENFCLNLKIFGENFSKIPGEIPKICQKIGFL